jgi:hypothetical protein
MRKLLFAVTSSFALLVVVETAPAARVEADPNKQYFLTPAAGPYIICVKGFIGENAQKLANQLTLHLRQQGYPAYVFDYTAEEERKAREMLAERYRMAPELARTRRVRIEKQWGVMIGGYQDMESASKDIAKVKKLPWSEAGTDGVVDSQGQILRVSPYAHAFATRNPLVPVQPVDPTSPDPLWKDLNAGRPYNLLKCGKAWTLAIKQFQGGNIVQPRSGASDFLTKLGFGSKSSDLLDASAKQAEEVARLLRAMKPPLDAYVLHTRGASIVTVGAFDSFDDPRLKQMQQQLRGGALKGLSGTDPQVAQLFRFFPEPMPMKVPQF